MKFSGIMLGTDNPTALAAFYTKVLGEPGWHDGDWYGYNDGANIMIGPHSEVTGKSDTPARIMITFEAEDVADEFKRVKEAGAQVIAEPYNPDKSNDSLWLATLADPDGNYLQIASPWTE